MDILSKFGERLSEYMTEHNFTVAGLAKAADSNSATISECMRGMHYPSAKVLYKMLDIFGCPADYLLGLSDYCRDNVSYKPVPQFGQSFRYVLKFCGVTQYRIEKELHLSGSMVYKWLNDISLPSVSSLIRVASYLDVTVDFLIGRTD